ncbi:6,7-dimethyl-8-ribityllumazine synthase [Kineosphaera limosa NBRC 100340]|uniref:6,7-dimethyl-8-ribityllumazine synthase n=1 Tax=Kineosphaera limosa NBRC 100340 TaxID=1184609 RepID=K6VJV5_9MICO|nr:6,7-dimethyl-8-ribityllumazine synthase [Kineosphaera limosa]GAB96508.1 6,7-dimethyl-8-ribityllumazine synthase [Kineosphaera limosa NBRC 100340]
MVGAGSPEFSVDASGLSVAVVAARWHEAFMDGLLDGATRALGEAGVNDPTVVRVPGSFELPVAVAHLARTHDAVVALGVVIKGGTPHFHFVADAVSQQLARIAVDSGKPVGFGLLTCDNEAQARDRSGLSGSHESKGYEAAQAAIATAVALRDLP